MSNQLTFQNTTLTAIQRNNQTYISSSDLAKALQYADASSVVRIYSRNEDEFTTNMSDTVKLTVSGNLETTTRIFSLRGCHLIAMFARTKVAKDFRKWVLDILDRETLQNTQKNTNTASVGSAPLAIEHKKAVEPEKEVKPFTDKELQLLVRVWHHSETMRHWLLKLSDPLKWLNSSYADDAFEAQTFKRDLQDFRFLLIQHCEHIQRHTSSNIHPTAFEQMVYDMRKMCLRINTGREIINPI